MKKTLPMFLTNTKGQFIINFILLSFFFSTKTKAQWITLGSDSQIASSTTTHNAIAYYKSEIYIAFSDASNTSKAHVKKYANDTWTDLGLVSDGAATNINLAVDGNNIPYIIFRDGSISNKLTVKRYSNNAWQLVGAKGFATSSISVNSLAIDKNNIPYIAYGDATIGAVVKRYVESQTTPGSYSWEPVGGATGFSGGAIDLPSLAFDKTNGTSLYLAGTETANSKRLKVFKYDPASNSWSVIGSSLSTGEGRTPDITVKDGIVYVAYMDAGLGTPRVNVKYYNTTATSPVWSAFGSGTISGRIGTYVNLDINKLDILYVSFSDQRGSSSNIYDQRVRKCLSPTSPWADVANDSSALSSTEASAYGVMTIAGDSRPYIFYGRVSNLPTVKTFGDPWDDTPVVDAEVTSAKQMEYLTRGVVALRKSSSQVLITWRLLGTDPGSIGFNIYRDGVKLNSSPLTTSTNYLDNTTINGTYIIKDLVNGVEGAASTPVSVWASNYLTFPIQRPDGGTAPDGVAYTYEPTDGSAGDVDGDGEYEIFLKWNPTNYKDNAVSGFSGNQYLDCYKTNGTRLWRMDLGKNIRAGSHYTQFMVYDFDGDGKAEMACKTADGTIDGTGSVIGDASADYRNSEGFIVSGPEFLTMFNGLTGKAMSTVNFLPSRGNPLSWGDDGTNRVDRFVAAVAYLDGVKPSLIMGRGYYTRLVRVAWDFEGGQLKLRWIFDSNQTAHARYAGMGNHQMSVADVDGDGKQEILNGSSTINDNGKGLWTDGKGHGDALHVADMNPNIPGLEEWMCHEEDDKYQGLGLRLKNAKTGETYRGVTTTGDCARAMAADIDPNYPGYEMWGNIGSSTAQNYVYAFDGTPISTNVPSYNFGIWWDGDVCREILDRTVIDKWNPETKRANLCFAPHLTLPVDYVNGTKATPVLSADLFGDWREEVIFKGDDNASLWIFTTNFVSDKRFVTLMHDPQYRVSVAWQNSGYNQPPYPSFYLGNDMPTPPAPNIYTVQPTVMPVSLIGFKARPNGDKVNLTWTTAMEKNNKLFTIERSSNGRDFFSVSTVTGTGDSNKLQTYNAVDYSPVVGNSYYRLRQTDFDGKSTTSGTQLVQMLQKQEGLKISPNPIHSEVKLELLSNSDKLILSLHAIDGRRLLQTTGKLNEINARLNAIIPRMQPGLYSISILDGSNSYSQKVVKQ